MSKEQLKRQKFYIAVHVFVLKGNQVLIGKRQNTGWHDGFYDSIGGHLEYGESLKEAAARELYEEANIMVKEEDLKLFHVTQYNGEKAYIYFMFAAKKWLGKPKINEPEFTSDLEFFPINKLPEKTTPYVKKALQQLDSDQVAYSYFGN